MSTPLGPDLMSLFALFPPGDYLAGCEVVSAQSVPEPYHQLLVHEHHMTVTVEAHHRGSVNVEVLERKVEKDHYARKILLRLQGSDKVVQFGLVRIGFAYCTPQVRVEIMSEMVPLGRVLINHDVLRRIEPTAYLRVTPGPDLIRWFGLKHATLTFGRLAMIHCDGQPAIELLEIVAPEMT